MMLVSESCRSASASEWSLRKGADGESTQARDALFEKSYRDCMAAKGYDVPPPSARAE